MVKSSRTSHRYQNRYKSKRNSSRSRSNGNRTRSSTNKNALVSTATGTIDFASRLSTDVVDTLETIVSGLFNGASSVVATAGSVTDKVMSDVFDVKTTHLFRGAGKFAKHIAHGLGGAVRKIPCVGNTSGYIVESAGSGVFHVILSVGKLVGSASRRAGHVVKKTSDLIVYVLHVTDDQIKDTSGHVKDIVSRLTNTVVGRSHKTLTSD